MNVITWFSSTYNAVLSTKQISPDDAKEWARCIIRVIIATAMEKLLKIKSFCIRIISHEYRGWTLSVKGRQSNGLFDKWKTLGITRAVSCKNSKRNSSGYGWMNVIMWFSFPHDAVLSTKQMSPDDAKKWARCIIHVIVATASGFLLNKVLFPLDEYWSSLICSISKGDERVCPSKF